MRNKNQKELQDKPNILSLKEELKDRIIKLIQNGDNQGLKNEIEILDKLLKIGFFENESNEKKPISEAQKRKKLLAELEKRLKKLAIND